MKTWLSVMVILLAEVSVGFAADANSAVAEGNSTLVGNGPLQTIRGPLAKIFQFQIDGDQLKINRAAWDAAAKEIAKNAPNQNGAAPVVGAPQIGNRILINGGGGFGGGGFGGGFSGGFGSGASSSIEVLFQQIQRQAQVGSRGMSSGSGGSNNSRTASFSSDTLSGELSTSGDSVRLSLEEAVPPKRSLHLATSSEAGLRLELLCADGESIVLNQNRSGRCSAVVLTGDKTFADQAENFVALYKHDRQRIDADILPVLAQFGITPILSPDAPEVHQAVLAVLLRTPEETAEGKQLLDQLDSDSIDERDSAAKDLAERFALFSDLVEQRLNDKATPAEARNRFKALAELQTDSQAARQTVAILNLLNDPKYIISILDDVAPHESIKLTKRLEEITGEKLGPNSTDWKRWAQKNLK